MSSVQKKLQYQVEKIVQVASNTLVPQNGKPVESKVDEDDQDVDELAYKPKPHLLQSQYDDDNKTDQQRKVDLNFRFIVHPAQISSHIIETGPHC